MMLTRIAAMLLLAVVTMCFPGERIYAQASHPSSQVHPSHLPHSSHQFPYLHTDIDSLCRAVINEYADAPVCGIWQATTDATEIAILPAERWRTPAARELAGSHAGRAGSWVMVVTASPLPLLQPGTIIGVITPSAKNGTYTARIYTDIDDGAPSSLKTFILRMTDDGHMSMRIVRKGVEILPWRLLPWMIRSAVRYRNDAPQDIDGLIRLWPSPDKPTVIRRL